MNGVGFPLSGERLSGSDRTLDSTNSWCLHNPSNLGLKRLRCVIGELIDTEQNYVQSICDLDRGYLAQLRQDPGLDPSVLDTIFGQIGDLRVFHEQLLLSFQLHRENLIQLARVFLSNARQFEQLYVDFCINYCKSIRTLQEAKQMRTPLWNRLVTCQQNLGHQLPVETYLLKPVQRVLKYQLLLQECVKHCMSAIHSLTDDKRATRLERAASSSDGLDAAESGFDLLQHLNEAVPILGQALERMIKVADHINEKKRCRELIDQLRGMRLDVDSWGDLVLRGHFRIPGKKDLRLILLFHRAILLCKHTSGSQFAPSSGGGSGGSTDQLWFSAASSGTTDVGPSSSSLPSSNHASNGTAIQIREVISCANLMLVECIPKDALAFHILPFDNPKAQRTLQAPTLEIKRLWCREIKRLILENYDAAIPEKAKHIVLNMAELSTAQGLLNGVGKSVFASVDADNCHEGNYRLESRSNATYRTQTPDRVSASAVEPASRSSTGLRKQRYSDTTVPDITLKQFSACSRFDTRSSLLESSPSKPTPKSPSHEFAIDSVEGFDSVFHDVWNKIWSKHSHPSAQTNGSTTSPNSSGTCQLSDGPQESSPTVTGSTLCDPDADFRCIAVEINEERLGVCGSPTVDTTTKPPLHGITTSRSTGLLNHRRTEQTRHHKAPAPRPPGQSSSNGITNNNNSLNNNTSSRSNSNNTNPNSSLPEKSDRSLDRPRISSVYIDCPNASRYDVITFGRAYEHYIAKARAQVALSPRDLDEIFSPLRQLVQSDSPDTSVRAATVPLPGHAEVEGLRQRAATADRDPFFYRRTSPAQLTHLPSPNVNDGVLPCLPNVDGDDDVSSQGSSGASSPRHLVSQIAVAHSRSTKENHDSTRSNVVRPVDAPTCNGLQPVSLFPDRSSGSESDLIRNGCASARNRSTSVCHTGIGIRSALRRRKSIASPTDSPSRQPEGITHACPSGDSDHFLLKPEEPKNGLSGASKSSSPLNKGVYEFSHTRTGQSSPQKPRSLSTVNRAHVIELSQMLGLSRARKSPASSEPPSPPRGRCFLPTQGNNESSTRPVRRKSRAPPPPPPPPLPSCSVPNYVGSAASSGSGRAPLAEAEVVKDFEANVSTLSSVCRNQMKVSLARMADASPYADESSPYTRFRTSSSVHSTTQAVRVYGGRPAKPPRYPVNCPNNLNPIPGDSSPNSAHRAGRITSDPQSHTKGLSPSARSNKPFSRIDHPPTRGTVRNMIDKFQK